PSVPDFAKHVPRYSRGRFFNRPTGRVAVAKNAFLAVAVLCASAVAASAQEPAKPKANAMGQIDRVGAKAASPPEPHRGRVWEPSQGSQIRLMTLDPGHFHAALIQRESYPNVAPKVDIYAPVGTDLADHITRVARFNSRADKPTDWR